MPAIILRNRAPWIALAGGLAFTALGLAAAPKYAPTIRACGWRSRRCMPGRGSPDVKKALKSLHTAVDKGLSDPATLDRDAFAGLRQEVVERHRGAGNPV